MGTLKSWKHPQEESIHMPLYQPDNLRAWAGGELVNLGVVFTDITSSTILNERVGDAAMNAIREAHREAVEYWATAYAGFVVTDLGDGYLVVFRTVIQALDFVLQLRDAPGHALVTIHAGVTTGPVTVRHNTIYGRVVTLAARLEDAAKSNEICICSESKNHLDAYRTPRHVALPWQHLQCEFVGFPPLDVWRVPAS